jgi:diguanylate cyclase (GGDEF)-like protein
MILRSDKYQPVIAFVLSNLRVAIHDLEDQLGIDSLEYQANPVVPRDAQLVLADKQGKTELLLGWRRSHSFRDQTLTSLLLVLVIFLGLFGLIVWSPRNIRRLQDEIVRREAATRHLAMRDSLTGLPNRLHFLAMADETLASCSVMRPVYIGLMDLDRFKQVNDTYGHDAGDQLIREVAHRAGEVFGSENAVARLGGGEFAFILRTVRSDAQALVHMERLKNSISQDFAIEAAVLTPSASIGVACAPRDGTSIGRLLKAADIALYQVKSQGRGFALILDSPLGKEKRLA